MQWFRSALPRCVLWILLAGSTFADEPIVRRFTVPGTSTEIPCTVYPPGEIPTGKSGLVIHLYGSGGSHTDFNAGRPSYETFRKLLAERGYWLAVPELGPKHWMNDAACDKLDAVIAEMVAHDRIDPRRVHLLGTSMGGGSSLIYVMRRPAKIKSVVSVFPMTDFTRWLTEQPGYRGRVEEAHGITDENRQDVLQKISPQKHLDAFRQTPVFLLHGAKDGVVKPDHSREFAAGLKEKGSPVIYRESPEETHRDEIAVPYQQELADFLTKELPPGARSDAGGEVEGGPRAGALGAKVNPLIGTGGVSYLCGNVFPGATRPFGMVRLSPDTVAGNGQRATNMSGYYYHDDRLLGFSHTRLSGTGAVDGGNFLVMPGVGPGTAQDRRRGLDAKLDHQQETAFPGYYRITLADRGVTAELTATRRVGVHRYTFDDGVTPRLLMDVTSVLGKGRSEDGQVRILPEAREVEGSVRTFGTFAKRYGGLKTYFAARFSQPFSTHGTWSGDAFQENQTTSSGEDIGIALSFPPAGKTVVEMKLALSFVSIEQARANLDAEAGNFGFQQVLEEARAAWEDVLSLITVTGGSEKEQRIFYTALYRSCMMPTTFSDVSGTYLGFDNQVHTAEGFTYYTDMSLWDTFRTTHPLFNLIARDEQRDFLVSLVEMAKQGGYLPRWPSGNGYTNSMFGTPADLVVAESYLKGIRDFDVETAYQAMRKTALGPTVHSRFSGRAGIEEYLKHQYCPNDLMEQSVARTLEYCSADAAISGLAQALGKDDDAKLFAEHAGYYRHVWNPATQYFQARDSQGEFSPDFDPLLLTYVDFQKKFTKAYVEGSALQWRWAVPHDPAGLIGLFNTRDDFISELEEFFAKSIPHVGVVPNAYYWQGNQPDLFAAFLFNSAGRPDLTQKWSRWILAKKYGDQPNGLDGNDDGGTLSAWYVFASLGLYPVAGTDRFELTSPLWTRAEIRLGDQRLTIQAENASKKNLYIRQMKLNGFPIDRTHLSHADIAGGGVLHFEMDAVAAVARGE